MEFFELFLISIGLAMDAFAVAICKGLSINKIDIKKAFIIGIWFGIFQAIMPVIGYFVGDIFESALGEIDNIVAFLILSFIGGNMLKEGLSKEVSSFDGDISFKIMLPLAIATSIDALTVGVTFALFDINIAFAGLLIGLITFLLSFLGAFLGGRLGKSNTKVAQIMGGVILIALGIKNLFD